MIYIDNTKHVTTTNITLEVHERVFLIRLLNTGYWPLCVSDQSLTGSGVVTLKLHDVGEDIIKKLRRWLNATWIAYIYSQIYSISTGLSDIMTVHHVFYNNV